MGQNSSKEGGGYSYNSRDFFTRQVEFYRWRADPLLNTHIARVSFQLQTAVQDRQRLQRFLQGNVGEFVSLEQLAAMGQGKEQTGAQLMSFEQYMCTLADLRGRLGLGETLYALQAMLGGYEVLLGKVGRIRAEPECCFVTKQGEVRVWISRDFRSNEIDENKGEQSPLLTSEMGLIKKSLQMAQSLALNHTEFLHFGRQFRSCMERDILQNWNFGNSRKLVNGYAYAYKLSLPNSIKDALGRWTSSCTTSQVSSSQTSYQSSRVQSSYKEEMVSTCSMAIKQHIMTQGKRDMPRPLSHSDYSHSKPSSSSEFSHASVKTHSKKFSSTDIRNLSERGKACQSPKMSRSEVISNKGMPKPIEPPIPAQQRFRREREYAVAGEKGKEDVRFSPTPSPVLSGFHSVFNEKEKTTLKNSQRDGKKKLQKKVGTASKYAIFHQNQSRSLNTNEDTSRAVPQGKKPIVHFACEEPQKDDVDPLFAYARNKHSDPTLAHKHSSQPIQPKDPSLIQRGKTEINRSQYSECSDGNNYTYPMGCITIKTVNNLLQNNEVSLHESNGSFMSMGQSQVSEYQGMLCQMGRSVDILNLPSNKQVMSRRPNGSNAHLNRSNC